MSWKQENKAWWGSRDILNIRAIEESTKQWWMGVCSCPHLYAEITYHIATQTSLLSSQIEVMLQLLLHWCWFEQVVTLISQNLHRFGIFSPLSLFLSTGDVNSAAEEKNKRKLNNGRLSHCIIAYYEDKVFISSKHFLLPKIGKSLIFYSYQFSLQQGKCHDVKARLIKVNLKSEMNFYWLQRGQKLLCNLQNHAFSKTSLHWNSSSALTHLHYSQAAYLCPMYSTASWSAMCAKVAVGFIVRMHISCVTSP